MNALRLGDLATYLGGELFGDPDFVVQGVREPHEAKEGDLVFLFDAHFLEEVCASRAKAVVAGKGMRERLEGKFVLEVANPRLAFARILTLFHVPFYPPRGVHPLAFVHPKAKLGRDVAIGPFAVIEEDASVGDRTCIFPQVYVGKGVRIGSDCVLYPQVVVREYCVLGNRVILHSGVVVGADGFGYEWAEKRYEKVPQIGGVIIEDDVEIGANTTIDRATLGYTRVGRGTKIDNLVMIAHNVRVGENSIIVAQSGIAGSSEIGDGVIIGGQAGIIDHCRVGKGARIAARAGVTSEVFPGETVSGFPAQEHRQELKERALVRKLPEIWQRVKELEKHVRKLLGE